MRFLSVLSLGARLSLGGSRRVIGRLLLAGAAVSLAVGLLLNALGVFVAEGVRDRRIAARSEVNRSDGAPVPENHLLIAYSGVGRFRDQHIVTRFVAAVGEDPPMPPGLSRIPRPGQMAVSPALADLLASPDGSLVRPRYPGRIVEIVGPAGLLEPEELLAYVGARPEEIPRGNRSIVVGFGSEPVTPTADNSDPPERASFLASLDEPLFQVVFLASIGLLVPIGVLIATATRLSAAAREARLSAIRLIGGTPSQVRLAASVESLLAGAIGCALGLVVFLAGRPIVAALAPPDHGWFPSDIAPPAMVTSLVLVAVMCFALLVSLVTMRRVVITPLGTVRRAGRRVRARWRLLTLAAGLGGAVLILVGKERIIDAPGVLPYVVVFGSFGLTSIGVAAVAPLVGSLLADILERLSGGTGTLLGARRLRADPRAAGRIVAGLVVVVFGVGLAQGFIGAFALAEDQGSISLRPSTVRVRTFGPGVRDLPMRLDEVPGVSSVVPVWYGEVRGDGFENSAVVANCDALGPIFVQVPRCAPATVYVTRYGPSFSPRRLDLLINDNEVDISLAPSRVVRSSMLLGEQEGVFIPLASLPERALEGVRPSFLYAAASGPDTVERIRNLFPRPGYVAEVATRAEIARDWSGTSELPLISAGIELGTTLTLAIVAASMLVATVDAIGDRRRSFAMLAAAGTPVGALRRAVVVEIALPLLGGVALAVLTSIAVTRAFFTATAQSFDGRVVPIPFGPFVRLSVFASVAAGLAALATFSSLSRAIRPEALRSE